VATSTETMLKVVEPATEGLLAELPHATADDADAAVQRRRYGPLPSNAYIPLLRVESVRRQADRAAEPATPAARPHRTPGDPAARSATLPPGAVLRVAAVRAVLLVMLLVGAVIGALEVAVPIFATGHGSPAAAGLLIAALSVGGIAGATVYGSARWRATPVKRLLLLLALMTIWLGLTVAADTLVLIGVLLLLAGVPLNPALATFSLLIDDHVPAGAAAEAFGWLSTALACGTGAASALAATVAQRHDAQAAFLVAAIAGASATAVSAVAFRQRR
jgi:predicted MFS family arabinose efflux permease